MNPNLAELTIQFFISLLIAGGILWAALRWNFFKLPKKGIKTTFSGGFLLLGFVLYIVFLKLFSPLVADLFGLLDTVQEVAYVNVVALWGAAILLVLYTTLCRPAYRRQIWGQGSWLLQFRSALKGAITWIIAYPWVIVIGLFYTILVVIKRGELPRQIDQEMIRYLKDILDQKVLLYLTGFAVVAAVPVAEEILFRGLFQSYLRKWTSRSWAVFISSFVFAMMHFTVGQGESNLQLLPALFVLSCFLGTLYEKEQRLIASIGLHSTFNTVSILLLLALEN